MIIYLGQSFYVLYISIIILTSSVRYTSNGIRNNKAMYFEQEEYFKVQRYDVVIVWISS